MDTTDWLPIAGPPARISMSTPVYSPPVNSGPTTFLAPASILASGPSN